MASKELKQQISDLIADRLEYGSMDVMCDEILAIILSALQEPTEAMLKEAHKAEDESAVHNYGSLPSATDYWDFMLNASPLGEQSNG